MTELSDMVIDHRASARRKHYAATQPGVLAAHKTNLLLEAVYHLLAAIHDKPAASPSRYITGHTPECDGEHEGGCAKRADVFPQGPLLAGDQLTDDGPALPTDPGPVVASSPVAKKVTVPRKRATPAPRKTTKPAPSKGASK